MEAADKTGAARGARGENVRNLQLRAFVCVAPDVAVREAVERMEQAEMDAIFVCDGGRVVGVVSHRDLLAKTDDANLDHAAPVREFMRTEVQIVASDATLGDVVQVMNASGRAHVAVTEGEKFIGAISDLDIITYLAESYPREAINLPPVAAQAMDTREGG